MVNYSNLNDGDVSSSEQSTSNVALPPKFMDTINPFLMFSKGDLEAMNEDVNELIESDSSDDDSVDLGTDNLYIFFHFYLFLSNFECNVKCDIIENFHTIRKPTIE